MSQVFDLAPGLSVPEGKDMNLNHFLEGYALV